MRLLARALFCTLLVAVSSAFGASVAQPSSPVLQGALAGLLEASLEESEAAKVARFDELLATLQTSFSSEKRALPVKDLQDYLRLRNRSFSSARAAFDFYKLHGMVTPLGIRAADPMLIEKIISFELQELKAHPALADPSSKHGAMLRHFAEIYFASLQARATVDEKSQAWIDSSFYAAERFRQQKNPLGFLAIAVGAGLSVARSIGENVVNPVASKVLYGEGLQRKLRNKLHEEIVKLQSWPKEKKLSVLAEFQTVVDSTLAKNFAMISAPQSPRAGGLDGIRVELMKTYFANLSLRQKAALVWVAGADANFAKRPVIEQMQLALGAIGPMLPFLLREVSKSPDLKAIELMGTSLQPASEQWMRELENDLRLRGYFLESLNPAPLAVTPLKETFLIEVKGPNGVEKWVVQTASREARDKLADDKRVFLELAKSPELGRRWQQAGLPSLKGLVSTFLGLVETELDFSKARIAQEEARKLLQGKSIKNIHGRSWTVELAVPASLPVNDSRPDFLIQEFVQGEPLESARKKNPELVAAALESFAEAYLKSAFAKNGFVWAEPHERNLRIAVNEHDSRIKITLINLEKSETLTFDQLKAFYANVARLPWIELRKSAKNLEVTPEKSAELLELLELSGFEFNATTLKFGVGLLHLRSLIGAEKFKTLILKAVIANPSMVWGVLGAKLKQGLESFYKAPSTRVQRAMPVKCEHFF